MQALMAAAKEMGLLYTGDNTPVICLDLDTHGPVLIKKGCLGLFLLLAEEQEKDHFVLRQTTSKFAAMRFNDIDYPAKHLSFLYRFHKDKGEIFLKEYIEKYEQ